MTKYIKITKSAVVTFFAALVLAFIFVATTYAQESNEQLAKKYNVTFPIAELGGCSSLAECRNFCEDPVNHASCISFAKKKGFYKEDSVRTNKEELLAAAKTELDCDSHNSCMQFCHQEANREKCDAFAKKHNLGGGHVNNPEEEEFLEKAKEILGCSSAKECMNFCSQEANRAKCSQFAQTVGLQGGEHQVGPGGCSSEETCKAFCSDPQNSQICSEFSRSHGGSYSGPGGCNSEESCKTYCQAHPTECGGGLEEHISLQEYCSKTPNCSWINERCECRSETIDVDYGDYATECAKTSGCSWTGSSCQCSSQSGSTYSTPSPTEPSSETTTQSTSTPPPTDQTTTSSPAPSEVQGVTTGGGLVQLLLDWLRQ